MQQMASTSDVPYVDLLNAYPNIVLNEPAISAKYSKYSTNRDASGVAS
jgi:hypothetical protein